MDIVERLRSPEVFLTDGLISPVAETAAQEIEQLREYIKNWKDTDSAAIMALYQAKEEIERLRRRVEVLEMDYSHSIKEAIDLGEGWKKDCNEIEELRKELIHHQEKTRAAYKREAGWIQNISLAKDEIERLRAALDIISDKLYDKGEYDLWAAARNALWQGGKV